MNGTIMYVVICMYMCAYSACVRTYICVYVFLSAIFPSQQPLDPIPLTLYQNGLAMHSGPFRPYSDPLTRQFVIDLQDGYFPSELKHRYPEGIPFQVREACEAAGGGAV